ncbi:VOC family protein [Jannaschia marina]|uniref:hypothetical protein n=1 Tax=Jannaschia marina TaxID=2741674 RepID=UPI0015CCF411|nr:hypothetical protein [Jannaschia marina]
MKSLRAMPVVAVRDVAAAAAFWGRAGFATLGVWGDGFSIVQRGDVTFGLRKGTPVAGDWVAYVYVSDVDALHVELSDAGLATTGIRRNEHYGCDDFEVHDPDGQIVLFGQARNPHPGPGLNDDRGRG